MNDYNPLDDQLLLPKLTELEEQQEWNQELLKKINKAKPIVKELMDYAKIMKNVYLFEMLKKTKI
jgi:hypothetical protein